MKKWMAGLVVVAVALISGCTTMKGGDAVVEIVHSKEVQLTNVSVKHEAGRMMVSGTLRPTSSSVRRTGHVDVEFVGTDGEVLITMKAEQHLTEFKRRSVRKPTFSASVALEDSAVKTVRLSHHVDTQKQCEM